MVEVELDRLFRRSTKPGFRIQNFLEIQSSPHHSTAQVKVRHGSSSKNRNKKRTSIASPTQTRSWTDHCRDDVVMEGFCQRCVFSCQVWETFEIGHVGCYTTRGCEECDGPHVGKAGRAQQSQAMSVSLRLVEPVPWVGVGIFQLE